MDPTLVPVYTGNDCFIQVTPNGSQNPVNVAVAQQISVSRMVNRRQVYAIGTPYWEDAPVSQVGVQVSMTNMVPLSGGLPSAGIVPAGSLTEALTQPFATFTIVDSNGKSVCRIINAAFQQDSVEVTANDPLTYNASWIAQDAALI